MYAVLWMEKLCQTLVTSNIENCVDDPGYLNGILLRLKALVHRFLVFHSHLVCFMLVFPSRQPRQRLRVVSDSLICSYENS